MQRRHKNKLQWKDICMKERKDVSNHDNIMALTQWWWPTEDVFVEHDSALDRGLHEVMVDGGHRGVHHERDQEEEDGKCADPWNYHLHHFLPRKLKTAFKLESLHWYFQCLCQCKSQYDVKFWTCLSLINWNMYFKWIIWWPLMTMKSDLIIVA